MLGPLSRLSEPHAYDLCREHASRMTAPRGWELLRVAGGEEATDDLLALADAVRRRDGQDAPAPAAARSERSTVRAGADPAPARHLQVVRSTDD